MSGCILWDFHGTLAARSWSQTLLEVLRIHEPQHPATKEEIALGLRSGFPWHRADESHAELSDPDDWWRVVGSLLERAYRGVGLADERARTLSQHAATRYVDPAHYDVYHDTRPALETLRAHGWRHWILSNHVPELAAIVDGLGLGDLFEGVFTSATMGYEKPHPRIFEMAREALGRPSDLWMVGDNINADVLGAQRCGIPAVLVRQDDDRADRRCEDLHGVAAFLHTVTDD